MAIPDLNKIMQQAQQVQKNIQEAQKKISQLLVIGVAGAGAQVVKVTMNGQHFVKSVNISPALINEDESDTLEDLIVAAINDATRKVEAKSREEMGKLMENVELPENFKNSFLNQSKDKEN